MPKRNAISKRTRFEVFKRDAFACQYCGRTPPQVVLQADHIVPVCDGGTEDRDNLLTACVDCNQGKAGISLDRIPQALDAQIQERIDAAEQVKQYNQFLRELRENVEDEIDEIGVHWHKLLMPKSRKEYVFTGPRASSVRRFLKSLPSEEIIDAIDIAFASKPPYGKNDYRTFKYFCGVCWNKIKECEK